MLVKARSNRMVECLPPLGRIVRFQDQSERWEQGFASGKAGSRQRRLPAASTIAETGRVIVEQWGERS